MPPPAHWTPAAPSATTAAASHHPAADAAPAQQRAGERQHDGDAADDHADGGRVGLAHALDHEDVEQHQAGRRQGEQAGDLARPQTGQAPARDREQREAGDRVAHGLACGERIALDDVRRRDQRADHRERGGGQQGSAQRRAHRSQRMLQLVRCLEPVHPLWIGPVRWSCSCGWSAARRPCGPRSRSSCATRSRSGRLAPGIALPSSRSLAHELGVSRGVVVDAYAQLAAEGYLVSTQGAPTRVSEAAIPAALAVPAPGADQPPRFDFRPGGPDVSLFPRASMARVAAARATRRPGLAARLRRPARRTRAARRPDALPRPRPRRPRRPRARRDHLGHGPGHGALRPRARRPRLAAHRDGGPVQHARARAADRQRPRGAAGAGRRGRPERRPARAARPEPRSSPPPPTSSRSGSCWRPSAGPR